MFGGLDNYKTPNWAYLQLDSRGSIKATVKTPKKIGKLDLGRIGGRTLASADADFILGGQTAMKVAKGTSFSDAAKSAWDNLSIYGGLSHTGNFLKAHWRVFYVIPDHVGGAFHLLKDINSGWSLEQEIDKNAWYVGGGRSASTQVTSIPLGVLRDDETGEQVGIAVLETSLFELPVAEPQDALYATVGANGRYSEMITSPLNSGADTLLLQLFPKNATLAELKNGLEITLPDGSPLTLVDPIITGNVFTNPEQANCTDIVDDELGEGLLIATGLTADMEQTFTVEADCDFTYVLSASAKPTTLNFSLSGHAAESTIENKRDGKTYAVRYYLDTQPDRSGEHYFLDMIESEPFDYTVLAEGSLAPTGEYHVTAVLVDRITGDFNGDGEISEDEYSWVTVDTATSTATISYTNVNTPSEPTNVTLAATGNETLTAEWEAPTIGGADGYRVTLYYEEGGEWKQAGAPYELENADFAANSNQPAATISGSTYSLRMAPTVHGNELEISGTENPSVTGTGAAYDDARANMNYYVKVESFKHDANASGEDGALDTRYYSAPAKSNEINLPAYTPKAITVTASNGQQVTLNSDNGYDTLTWKELPDGTLFTINDYSGFTVEIAPEPGTGTFTVGTNGDVTADDNGKALIEGSGRVKLTVTEGNDTTEYYLRLTLDDIAPVVTLDNENVAADPNTGKYAITGTTEPGLSVKLTIPRATEQDDDADDEVVIATADDTGRFTFPGVLTRNSGTDPSETAGFESLLGKVTAQDSMGNLSDPAAVIVTPREQWTPPENPSSGGSSGSSKRPSEQEHDEESPFRDVFESDWFYEDVLFAHSEGLLKGTAKRTFSPYASTTRAMIATVLWRMDGSPDAKSDSRFTDVAGDQWYSDAVAWADENGIVRGFGDGTFAPNAPVTREQFAAMLYRYAQYSGDAVEPSRSLADFNDADQVSTWAKDAMRWAVSSGILTGKPGKRLDPQGTATRAEIAAMLRRFLKT